MASPTVAPGDKRGEYLPLDQQTSAIGRAESPALQILNDRVSRQHLRMRVDKTTGKYYALDMGSKHGLSPKEDLPQPFDTDYQRTQSPFLRRQHHVPPLFAWLSALVAGTAALLASVNWSKSLSFSFELVLASRNSTHFSANCLSAVSNRADSFHPCCPPCRLFR
jgi:hypothetical protein